jgi:uncharacterized hydrophobic protein (TIGR00271 family)
MARVGQREPIRQLAWIRWIPGLQRVIDWIIWQAPQEERDRLRADLFEESCLSLNYLVLAVCACAIATFGLLTNSAAVIIGAMVVAPLMLPLRGAAFGAIQGDFPLLRHSLLALAVGTAASVAMAVGLQLVVSLPESAFGVEILNRTQPTLIDLGIAIAAGFVSAFAKVRPRLSDVLAGTAIAVALMPPLCVTGIYLAVGNWGASRGAFLLYTTNLLGITLACTLVFAANGFHVSFRRTGRTLLVGSVLTVLVAVPLFRSFAGLIVQARLRENLRQVLERETVTVGQQVQLRQMRVNWNVLPHRVVLDVDAREAVTPEQVAAVENYVQRRLGWAARKFALEFQVNQYRRVVGQPTPGAGEQLGLLAKQMYLGQLVRRTFDPTNRPAIATLQLEEMAVDWQRSPVAVELTLTSAGPLPEVAARSLTAGLEQRIRGEMGLETRVRLRTTVVPTVAAIADLDLDQEAAGAGAGQLRPGAFPTTLPPQGDRP